MRTDYPKDRKSTEELIQAASRKVALVLAFISVFFFFVKILFL